MHDFMETHMRQTARGQCFAVELAIAETAEDHKISQSQFDALCGVCGFWCILQDQILPMLGLGDSVVLEMLEEFKKQGSQGGIRSACGDILLQEPHSCDS